MHATGIGVHLYVILSDPGQNDEAVLVVSFSTVRGGRHEDRSCVVEPGEHVDLPDQSFVYYAQGKILPAKFIRSYAKQRQALSAEIFERVLDGADASDHFKQDFRQMLVDQGLL